jgi:hypothetical protein
MKIELTTYLANEIGNLRRGRIDDCDELADGISALLERCSDKDTEMAALREAGQQALDALTLTHCNAKHEQDCDVCNAIEALAQAVQA